MSSENYEFVELLLYKNHISHLHIYFSQIFPIVKIANESKMRSRQTMIDCKLVPTKEQRDFSNTCIEKKIKNN